MPGEAAHPTLRLMGPRMTLEEIQRTYPKEWVFVADCGRDGYGVVQDGVVVDHGPDDEPLLDLLATFNGDSAMWYVGNPLDPNKCRAGLAIMEWDPLPTVPGTVLSVSPSISGVRRVPDTR